jgi:hypothetical protein
MLGNMFSFLRDRDRKRETSIFVNYSEAARPTTAMTFPEVVRDDRQQDTPHYATIIIALTPTALDTNDKRLLSGRLLIQFTFNIL